MLILNWKHGTTRADAKKKIQAELVKLGMDSKITWTGDTAAAVVGNGAKLTLEVTDDAVIVQKAGGVGGGEVLRKCQALLSRLFVHGDKEA